MLRWRSYMQALYMVVNIEYFTVFSVVVKQLSALFFVTKTNLDTKTFALLGTYFIIHISYKLYKYIYSALTYNSTCTY